MVFGTTFFSAMVFSFGKSAVFVGSSLDTSTSFLTFTGLLETDFTGISFLTASFLAFLAFTFTNAIPHLGQSPGFVS